MLEKMLKKEKTINDKIANRLQKLFPDIYDDIYEDVRYIEGTERISILMVAIPPIKKQKFIKAIKEVRNKSGWSLKKSKDFCDDICDKNEIDYDSGYDSEKGYPDVIRSIKPEILQEMKDYENEFPEYFV